MQTEYLLHTLSEQTKNIISQVEQLKNSDLHSLTWKQNPNSWSILECLEHLNLYGEFYLPQIEQKLKLSTIKNESEFKSGFLGNYFAKSMLPKEKLNKMNTFKDKNPLNAQLDRTVIDKFLKQQIKLLELLEQASNKNLNKIRIEISITSLIKLKLGDTFQFIINHIIRHLQQIERIKSEMKAAN